MAAPVCMLLLLNCETFSNDRPKEADELAEQIRMVRAAGVSILLIHDVISCDFDKVQLGTPDDLVMTGLYSRLAVAYVYDDWHTGESDASMECSISLYLALRQINQLASPPPKQEGRTLSSRVSLSVRGNDALQSAMNTMRLAARAFSLFSRKAADDDLMEGSVNPRKFPKRRPPPPRRLASSKKLSQKDLIVKRARRASFTMDRASYAMPPAKVSWGFKHKKSPRPRPSYGNEWL